MVFIPEKKTDVALNTVILFVLFLGLFNVNNQENILPFRLKLLKTSFVSNYRTINCVHALTLHFI